MIVSRLGNEIILVLVLLESEFKVQYTQICRERAFKMHLV